MPSDHAAHSRCRVIVMQNQQWPWDPASLAKSFPGRHSLCQLQTGFIGRLLCLWIGVCPGYAWSFLPTGTVCCPCGSVWLSSAWKSLGIDSTGKSPDSSPNASFPCADCFFCLLFVMKTEGLCKNTPVCPLAFLIREWAV